NGGEPPWTVGETRTIEGPVTLCERGYHWAPSWFDALQYAPGPMACIVEVPDADIPQGDKGVSVTRTLVAARDVSHELRLFACDCAERALGRERAAGREPDARSWKAVAVARTYAEGQATALELDAARDAAWAAARDAAGAAAWDAARAAAWAAAWAAGRDAAWAAGRDAAWAAARAAAWAAAGAAAWAAERDAAGAAAWAAERDWQRQRLAELLDPLFGEDA
ncbi:MAG: hypothetical protein ACYDC2_11795, partial [Solirubrobacteraceae bacterium]